MKVQNKKNIDDTIVLTNKVGNILRKERDTRKLSLREVSRDTSISVRYLEALENDDFSQFPGETYAIGFLSNYANYLNLDRNRLIRLFRQQQIDSSPTPIEELTRENPIVVALKYTPLGRFIGLGASLVAIVSISVILLSFFDFQALQLRFSNFSDAEAYCGGKREVRLASLPLRGALPRSEMLSLNPPDALHLSADNLSLRICLTKIKAEGVTSPLGVFHVRINEKSNYSFEVQEKISFILSNKIPELKDLTRKFTFTPVVLSQFSARIELEVPEVFAVEDTDERPVHQELSPDVEVSDKNIKPKASVAYQRDIQVTLEFVKSSYVEWVKDGKFFRGRMIPAGEAHTYEAHNRLEIKIGNGGGVKVRREGKRTRFAGPAAHIVKLSYRRIPDPLDPAISVINELVEVVQ